MTPTPTRSSFDLARNAIDTLRRFRQASRRQGLQRLEDAYIGRFRVADSDKPWRLLKAAVAKDTADRFLDPTQRPDLYFPFLSGRPFWDKDEFARFLEKHADLIRDEFLSLEDTRLGEHPENLVLKGGWTTFEFYRQGRRDRNCAACPETVRVFEQLPHCGSWYGAVFFSALKPGTHVQAHCGPTNGRLRYHLGLEVPDGPTIRVKNEIRSWSEGGCLILDDSFNHEVMNPSAARRIILIVDLWHPELTEAEREFLTSETSGQITD